MPCHTQTLRVIFAGDGLQTLHHLACRHINHFKIDFNIAPAAARIANHQIRHGFMLPDRQSDFTTAMRSLW